VINKLLLMTIRNIDHYKKLAQIFSYPKTDYKDKVKEVETVLNKHYPETLATFKQFSDFVISCSIDEVTD